MKKRYYGFALSSLLVAFAAWTAVTQVRDHFREQRAHEALQEHERKVAAVRRTLDHVFKENSGWPQFIEVGADRYEVTYSFNQELTSFVEGLLRRYRSDYSAVVVLDNNTGKILAAVGYERASRQLNKSLAFSSTHPAASLIKVVTSAELLENTAVDVETVFHFRGRGTTLYRSQLETPPANRRAQQQTFERAFAYSNNVIFGKAAINNTDGLGIFRMATDFGFNVDLMNDISLTKSIFKMPTDDYNLAELASGFNRETMMSPIHASVLASIVANDGIKKTPRIIESVKNVATGEEIWVNDSKDRRIVATETAAGLKQMMEATTLQGTARGSFRRLPRQINGKLNIGGKTGSITGGAPFGRRDWFISYADPKESYKGKGISVAVMNVNVDKWYVKSTFLAKEIISHYYTRINPIDEITVASDVMSTPQNKSQMEL